MTALQKLYNAIKNDDSIQKCTLGWNALLLDIERRYRKPIPKTDDEFTNDLLDSAIVESKKGLLHDRLFSFKTQIELARKFFN